MKYVFFLFIVGYAILIFINSNLQVIDDHGILDNLMVGKFFDQYLLKSLFSIGRFYPLNMQEFNFINLFVAEPNVLYFYLLISIEFLVLNFVLHRIFRELDLNNYFMMIFVLIFTPAFVTAFLRLHIGERNVLFFFVVFLFFFIKYQKEQKIIYLLTGLISANVALYYKEPAFLMLGSFAFFHLVLGWKELNVKQKIFDALLMVSAFVFILIYFFVVYLHKGDSLYGETTVNSILQLAKTIFNYALSDPLIIFILLPLVLWRVYIIIKFKQANHFFDALLFSSAIYVLVFFKLNMFAHHYLLPAYAFGLIAIVYLVLEEQLYKKFIFKFLGVATGLFIIFSSLPTGIYCISHYKNVPNNFQNTLTFLNTYILEHSKDGNKIFIFLDRVNRNGGEVHISFIKYLEYKGLNSNQFDIKSDENDNGVLPIAPAKDDANYTILRQTNASEINDGDLIIITPYTNKYIGLDKKEIEKMSEKYELIYHADSFLEIPSITIKSLLKDLYRRYNNTSQDSKVMMSQNIYGLPLDFYVFRKRIQND